MGTQEEQQKSTTPTLPKNKKALGPWCMLSHFLGLKMVFLHTYVFHFFWPRLIVGAKLWVNIITKFFFFKKL
jgi:hypothetical protein